MANRQFPPNQANTVVANAAFCVLAALFASPALAALNSRIPCSEAVEVTFTADVESIASQTVAHNIPAPALIRESSEDGVSVVPTTSLLAPRAEEAIRDAFAESDSAAPAAPPAVLAKKALNPRMAGTESKSETDDDDDDINESASPMTTKLPGVSDIAMSRYKKQMFRRDI